MAGVSYAGGLGKEAEDWFLELRAREQEVREKTLALGQKRLDRWNKRHRKPPVFCPDKGRIWVRHPPNKSASLDPGWVGLLDVRSRIGETSYLLWTGVRAFSAHASMMQESYDSGFGAPGATLSHIGFSKRATGRRSSPRVRSGLHPWPYESGWPLWLSEQVERL